MVKKNTSNPAETNDGTSLYNAITGDKAAFIEGPDFVALNYGPTYPSGGVRWVKISGAKISYDSSTPVKKFPKKVYFEKIEQAYMGLVNASHISDYSPLSLKTKLNLEGLVDLLQSKGISFEK